MYGIGLFSPPILRLDRLEALEDEQPGRTGRLWTSLSGWMADGDEAARRDA